MMNIYERASRKKLRFTMAKGQIATEDLWELSLPALDLLAKSVNKACKDNSEESFIEAKTPAATEDDLRLDILKHVIAAKLAAKDAAAKRTANTERVAKLRELIEDKDDEAMKGKTKEELLAEITALETADA